MPRRFASILDECLAALAQGETVDDCLARYPKHAEELRVHLLLAKRVSATPQHQPRPGAQAAAWTQFRLQAEDRRLGRRPAFTFNFNWNWLRPLSIAAAVLIAVAGLTGGTVYASQDALPDSPLYRVKLASEEVRLWFVFDDASEADILLDQSNDRRDEIMEMLRDGKTVPGNVLTAMRQRNARAVRILEDHPEELALLSRANEQSADQEDLLLAIQGDISESAEDEYAEAVATLHNAQLRTSGAQGSVTPDDLAAGVINIAGSAQPAAEGTWLLGGVEVKLDAVTLGETQLEPGQRVNVVAARGADGRLLALSVKPRDIDQGEQQYVVSGSVEDLGDDEVVIAGQRIAITERTLLKLRLQRGRQVEIRVENIDGKAVASSVDGSVQEAPPTLLAYEGIIEDEVSTDRRTNDWMVGGQSFVVTPSTEIDAAGGTLAAGALAHVEALVEDGDVVAKRVVILSNDAADDIIRVEGVLSGEDDDGWTVSGVNVEPPKDVETPEVGSLVILEARRKGARLVAEKVDAAFDPGAGGLALIRGPVGSIDESGAWRVGLVPVRTTSEDTVISGRPQVGSRVFIWSSRDSEGSLHAIYVNVLDHAAKSDEDGGDNED